MTSNPNPFIIKKYIVIESPIWKNGCSNTEQVSEIIDNTTTSSYDTSITPMNIIEIEKYLSKEIDNFFFNIILAKQCDNYGMNIIPIPAKCKDTFKNFVTPSEPYITQFGIGSNVLNQFEFTDSYINSKNTSNDKKQLCQRILDLQSMIQQFTTILQSFQKYKDQFPDMYNDIMQKYNDNIQMRQLLEEKINTINSQETKFGNSKQFLDATIYTSVLWTILACTIVFYTFKKM